jgi:hypothetical protein
VKGKALDVEYHTPGFGDVVLHGPFTGSETGSDENSRFRMN